MLLISFNRTLTVMLHHFVKYSLTLLSCMCKSNTDFDTAPLRQILTKCSKVKHVYEVLCAK